MNEIAVSVRGVSKSYTIAHDKEKPDTLVSALLGRLKDPLRRPNSETFWALKDVSFDINKGDVVGIIGRNGAGKSTLLKILSRITEPTTGEIHVFGRIGSLLEVGTGFHPELSGRENVFLNGAILGMAKSEIRKQFDAIVDFAGVEKFLDTPVKRYSSGMYVRLAFAVAAHLNPEILIIDEVLAVGDADFQRKCIGKMKDVSASGRTVLFVSHNAAAIRSLCTRALLLRAGKVADFGAVAPVLNQYFAATAGDRTGRIAFKSSLPGLALRDVYFTDPSTGRRADQLFFGMDYDLCLDFDPASVSTRGAAVVVVWDQEATRISTLATAEEGLPFFDLAELKAVRFSLPQLSIAPGSYRLSVILCDQHMVHLDSESAMEINVEPLTLQGAAWPYNRTHGFYRLARGARIETT